MQFEDEENQSGMLQHLKKFNSFQLSDIQKRNIVKEKKKSFIDLVYLEESPNYCQADSLQGTIGTKGRICDKDLNSLKSCDMLCCGRGYNSYTKEVFSKCNCKFRWCCQVNI